MRQVCEIRKLTGGRYLVCLEDGQSFPLYGKELTDYAICEELSISDEIFTEILQQLLPKRAVLRAMHLLEKKDWTEQQLREKLAQQYYPAESIEYAIEYVKNYHYLDDYRYAQSYIDGRCQSRGIRQIEQELYRRGISREIVEKAVREAEVPDELSQIRSLLARKNYDPDGSDQKEKARMYAFLMRRGYDSSAVQKALQLRK